MGGGQGSSAPQASGAGQATGFGEGLPIIGNLLNGDGKNQGAPGSSGPMVPDWGALTDLQAILGKFGGQ